MQKIINCEKSGKTAELIKISAENNATIICLSREKADRIMLQAKEMDCKIRNPLTFEDLLEVNRLRGLGKFVLDDADILIEKLFGRAYGHCLALTMTDYSVPKEFQESGNGTGENCRPWEIPANASSPPIEKVKLSEFKVDVTATLTDELKSILAEIKKSAEHLKELESKKTPHKCPVCDGSGFKKILMRSPPPYYFGSTSQVKRVFDLGAHWEVWFSCEACEKGVVWR